MMKIERYKLGLLTTIELFPSTNRSFGNFRQKLMNAHLTMWEIPMGICLGGYEGIYVHSHTMGFPHPQRVVPEGSH